MKYFGIVAIAMMLAPAESRAQQPLVVDTPFVHDPVMAYENGKYYLYCTGHGITQMTSTDRKHWTIVPQGVLKNSEIPAWTHDSVPGFTTHIWAPDVIRFKNKWYLAYSCSTFGKNTSAIGLLSNTSLSDKDGWKDEGCLVASKGDRDNWNAIDPNFIVDEKGNPWLTWGSFWDGIQMIKLDKKTMHVKKGAKPQTIARRHAVGDTSAEPNPTSKFAGTNAIEAPFIMKHGGYYYLFVSWDYCCPIEYFRDFSQTMMFFGFLSRVQSKQQTPVGPAPIIKTVSSSVISDILVAQNPVARMSPTKSACSSLTESGILFKPVVA